MADTPDTSTFIPEGTAVGPGGEPGYVKIGDDLKEEAIETLASYLSSLTRDAMSGNPFPIDPDNPAQQFGLVNADSGTPAEFTTGGGDSTPGFTRTMPAGDNTSAGAVPKFDTLSNSGKFDEGDGSLGEYLNKNSQRDGNDLLRSFVSTGDNDDPGVGNPAGKTAFGNPSGAPPVQQKISQILMNGNRFDPNPSSSPYIEDGRFTEPGIPIEQGEFGVYDNDADRTAIADLQKVALSMLLRQTGHFRGDGDDPTRWTVDLETLLPTRVQSGAQKIDTTELRAENAYGAPPRPEVENGELRYDDISGDPLLPRESVGVLNSHEEQFGKSVIAQITVTLAAFGEVLLAGMIFGAIMTIIEMLARGAAIPGSPAQMRKGYHRPLSTIQKIIYGLGIPKTGAPIWVCVCYGIAAFFKIPGSMLPPVPGIPGGGATGIVAWFTSLLFRAGPNILSVFFNMQYSAGYYATILRVVRMDIRRLLDVFADFPLPNPLGGAYVIYDLIRNMNSFISWRFFCTLALMGDRYLQAKQRTFAEVRQIDIMPDNGQTRQAKSRVTTGNPALAWRHRSSPAAILLPNKLRGAYRMYGYGAQYAQNTMGRIGDGNSFNVGQPYEGKRRKVYSLDAKRIPQDIREATERELNSEYCPFYFHDLRTNEVISFHAFLESLSDSYSVSYAESAGYGRIDPVKIYQNTSRSISLTWTVLATSAEDFDSMWWSINKLVSMLYPQFSMGKPLQAGTKKFIMPFSQIPTATPVIRLRVGDVIRSNYSRFNLARIFGLSEGRPAHDIDSPDATGSTSDAAGIAAGSNAPFDLTYTEQQAEAMADATTAGASATASIEAQRVAALSMEPTSWADYDHGFQIYVMDTQPSTQMGRAYLKPNPSGYTCYDTDSLPPNFLPDSFGYFPPPFQTNPAAILTEETPWRTVISTKGIVKIIGRRIVDPTDGENEGLNMDGTQTMPYAEYAVQYVDQGDTADPYHPEVKGHYHTFICCAADLEPLPVVSTIPIPVPPNVSLTEQVNDIYDFFNPENNAIVRSFEAAGGQGLAGVITAFDMDWGEAMWDMSAMGRRAPQFIKCSVSFSPIHDIIPGLDNNGAMRAYNYPVGQIASGLQEDFFDYGAAEGVQGRLNETPTYLPDSANNSETLVNFRQNVVNAYGESAEEPGID